MLKLKDGGKYVRRDGKIETVSRNTSGEWQRSHPFRGDSGNTFTEHGLWGCDGATCGDYRDLVAVYDGPFSISPGNYYRTRDGRKAYVATSGVDVSIEGCVSQAFFGYTEFDDEYSPSWWGSNGVSDPVCEQDGDLVAPWHPETLTDPTTGKKYRVAEEVT